MKKIFAWTLAELVVAMTAIVVISAACMTMFKPNDQKARLFVFATIRNLVRANSLIMEKHDALTGGAIGGKDWYCLQITDAFALNGAPVCTTSSGINVVNATLPNNVTIQGLASAWKEPYPDARFKFKNIVIDIDGSKGLNRVWADRFPLRVFDGEGYQGAIQPVNCADDSIYDETGAKKALTDATGKSPYCKNGFNSNGSAVSIDFRNDNNIISYDILRTTTADEETKTQVIASNLSPIAADCQTYAGKGFYTNSECFALGYKLLIDCASYELCKDCNLIKNVCPSGTSDVNSCRTSGKTANGGNDELECFTLMHKPNAGMSFVVESLVGELDDGN